MNIPSKEKVVSEIETFFRIKLSPVIGKQIFYHGYSNETKNIIVCTPYSKLHADGFGWTDITSVQFSLLETADLPILAFRLEGGNVYYTNFAILKKHLIKDAMVYNDRESDHWKIRIWPDNLQVLNNPNRLQIRPNNIEKLKNI